MLLIRRKKTLLPGDRESLRLPNALFVSKIYLNLSWPPRGQQIHQR